jgi:hypothetical protein
MENLTGYKRYIFLSIVIIVLGIIISTVLKGNNTSIGTVFIATGGLFFIVGMSKKKQSEKEIEQNNP